MHQSTTITSLKTAIMDKRDEEILQLKQKLIDLMKENNEMKELILFLDDERNYARQFVRDFNNKQSLNWSSLKHKLNYLEQKQAELIQENYSLKQLCILLDENSHHSPPILNQALATNSNNPENQSSSSSPPSSSSLLLASLNKSSSTSICQYILHLEQELKSRGVLLNRPKYVHDLLKLNSIRENHSNNTNSSNNQNNNHNGGGSTEEKALIYSLSETAIKSILNR